jgi:hypothetical protein
MISGYMWNQIRKPPSMQVTPQGGAIYIASGFSNQYGVETQIISVICELSFFERILCSCYCSAALFFTGLFTRIAD